MPFAALALLSGAILVPAAAPAQCNATPRAGCKQPTVGDKAFLLVKSAGGADDKLTWKWIKGEETLPVEVGDPTASTDFTLCIYDSNGGPPTLVSQSIITAGTSWEASGAGFKYKDPSGSSSGITKMVIKPGEAGKAKILVKGAGSFLDTPVLPLDQNPEVVGQLSNDIGSCWEARFSPPTKKNESEMFKDKGDPPVAGPTPTATPPGGGATPTGTPTPTNTPMGGGSCGNNVLEAGETCATCAADCVVQACTPVGPTIAFTMTLVPPPGQAPTDASVRLGYHSGKLDIPGTGSAASVLGRVTAPAPAPNPFIRNDQNYALAVTLGRATPLGVLFTVTFDRCQGAPAPSVADLGCSIEGCAGGGPPIEGCTCTISQP
jgi:hypothetical protein